uniref:Peroxiredoxin-like 2A n=1 Tax=Globodera rostochiensis TaxID=31243 RepID=A0A914I164_GLORO
MKLSKSLMLMTFVGCGAIAAALSGIILYANLPTRMTIGAIVPTVEYLAGTRLKKLELGHGAQSALAGPEIKAGELFNSGSPLLVMAASALCNARDRFADKGVRVVGVVHEQLGVDQFRPFLSCADAIYWDEEKRFFGPSQRWLPLWMGFLRLSTYVNYYKTSKAGFDGNKEGEGRLLGGVYLVNGDKMLFAHLEQEWGDEANMNKLLDAVAKI